LYSADYQYDDKINPYYGLIGSGITEQRRYSFNIIVKSTYTPDVTYPTANQTTEVASYEYNAQEYPTWVIYPSGISAQLKPVLKCSERQLKKGSGW